MVGAKQNERDKRLVRRMLAQAKTMPHRSMVLLICNSTLDKQTQVAKNILTEHKPSCTVICISIVHKNYTDILNDNAVMQNISTGLQQYPKNCIAIYTDSALYAYKKTVLEIVHVVQKEIALQWKNHSTSFVLGPRWIKNIFYNIHPQNTKNNKLTFGIPQITGNALVIGAGPSLSVPVLECISKHREKIILLAVDTALPTLQHYNMYPDVCVILESQYYNITDFIPSPSQKTYALADLSVFPSSHKIFNNTLFFCTQFAKLSFFKRLQQLFPPAYFAPPLGSVGISAVQHALNAKPQTTTLVGLDFAFYKGKSHCSYSAAHKNYIINTNKKIAWESAKNHFTNNNLYSINADNNTHGIKTSDSTLTMYARSLDKLLYKNNTYELNNSHSMLQNTQAISLDEYGDLLQSSDTASLTWNSCDITKNDLHSFLQNEYQLSHDCIDSIKNLAQKKTIPSVQEWNDGIDFYAYTLADDPYLLQTSAKYWLEQDVYTKVVLNAKKIMYYLESLLSYC